MNTKITHVLIILLFWTCPSVSVLDAFADIGGVDDKGGHYDRKTGEYHYHKAKNPGVAFVSSFLVTGGGQVYNRQYGKASLLFGGFALGTYLAYASYNDYEEGYRLLGNYYQFTDDYDENLEAMLAGCCLAGGSWLLSMLDAVVTAHKINLHVQQSALRRINLRISPIASHNRSGAVLAFRW